LFASSLPPFGLLQRFNATLVVGGPEKDAPM
jgi:hypothetical protein